MFGRLRHGWGFLSGFVVASFLFGSLATAADITQKDIRVSYLPLKYIVDGTELAPPADQQGFTFNGRTYVPLRFLAESLGKKVEYDPATYGIYVGRRPSPMPAMWQGFTTQGAGLLKAEYYQEGVVNTRGEAISNSLLLTATTLKDTNPTGTEQTIQLVKDFQVGQQYGNITGKLITPVHYFGDLKERKIGHLVFMDENNRVIHKTDTLTSSLMEVPFDIPIATVNRVRIFVVIYQTEGLPQGEDLLATQMGVADFLLHAK